MVLNLIEEHRSTPSSSACAYSHSATRWDKVFQGLKERLGGYRTLEDAVVVENDAGFTK